MDLLHSCRVAGHKQGKVLLSSISGRCDFWMNESDDKKLEGHQINIFTMGDFYD